MSEPDNLVLVMLRDMRGEIGELRSEMNDMRGEVADIRGEMATRKDIADVRAEIAASETRVGERISGLQRAVMEYHSTVIGHGVLYTEVDERLRRVEQQLKLPPTESH